MKKDLHFELQERIKELSCLYGISKIVQQNEKHTDVLLEEICRCIPGGWGYPDAAVARLVFDGKTFTSGEVPVPSVYQHASILIDNESRGQVEVHYSKSSGHGFFNEEQLLIDKIAQEIALLTETREKRERQQLFERHLRHNDRLNILGELTAGIAHELNTPVGNILGYAELILREAKNDSIKKDAGKIISSAIHAREVIKKLMFFSCEMPSQFEKNDFNHMVRESLRLLQGKFENSGVTVELALDERMPPVRFDNIQMTQVLFNLVLNALHAMPEGGRLRLQTALTGHTIALYVEDTGHGIPDDVMDHIYQPFFTTKPVGEGTGLGLAVVHGIVKAHNGNIRVTSTPGTGTKFSIELPV